jgi:hypothetical protein
VIGNYIRQNGGNAIWFDRQRRRPHRGNKISLNMKDGKSIPMERNSGTAIIRNKQGETIQSVV